MNKQKILIATLAAMGIFSAAGCQTNRVNRAATEPISSPSSAANVSAAETATPTVTATPNTTGTNQNQLSSFDREFATQAARAGMTEVELGQLASQKGNSVEVKQYGLRMVRDHTQANNQLKQLATRENISLPQQLSNRKQKIENNLSQLQGTNFDRQYINQMIQDHTKVISLFEQEARQGKNPELKNWASTTLPILQEHLQSARSIQGNITKNPS